MKKKGDLMKKHKRKIIFGSLIVAWMIIIFIFSAQNGTTSSGESQKIANIIIKLFIKDYDTLSLETQKEILSNVGFIVRKGAHMTEYAILALLCYFFFTKNLNVFRFLIPILVSFVYACTDEFHQSFVAGRGPSFVDVLFDTLGAVIMILIIMLISFIIKRIKLKKEKRALQ